MDRRSQPLAALAAALVSACLAGPAHAQDLTRIDDVLTRNQERLRAFVWSSRTEVRLGEGAARVQHFTVRVGTDLRLEKTPVEASGPAAAEGGPIRRLRAGRSRRKQESLHAELVGLIDSYVHAGSRGATGVRRDRTLWSGEPQGDGLVLVRARGVRREGDRVEFWIEEASGKPRRLELLTSLDGEPVRVRTDFETLEGGPFYPVRTRIESEIGEKPLVVVTENYDFRPAGD